MQPPPTVPVPTKPIFTVMFVSFYFLALCRMRGIVRFNRAFPVLRIVCPGLQIAGHQILVGLASRHHARLAILHEDDGRPRLTVVGA